MILGYVDRDDRMYDLNFATMRMRLQIEAAKKGSGSRVTFSQVGASGAASYAVTGESDATAEVSMDHDGHRVPLLRPVEGHVVRHEAGLLFLASPARRDPDDPGFFLVKLQAMPSAVRFFFEDQEGRELISIPRDELLRIEKEGGGMTMYVSAANIALPKEKIAYAVGLRPASRVARLLEDFAPAPRRGRNP